MPTVESSIGETNANPFAESVSVQGWQNLKAVPIALSDMRGTDDADHILDVESE